MVLSPIILSKLHPRHLLKCQIINTNPREKWDGWRGCAEMPNIRAPYFPPGYGGIYNTGNQNIGVFDSYVQ
jgi:hypothetical protein